MKTDDQKKAGVLKSISILERAWQQITTDLVTDLPESEDKTTIAVFVDLLTNMTYVVQCMKEVTPLSMLGLFADNVFWLRGMPEVILSDQGPMVVSKFGRDFIRLGSGPSIQYYLPSSNGCAVRGYHSGLGRFFAIVCGTLSICLGRSAPSSRVFCQQCN